MDKIKDLLQIPSVKKIIEPQIALWTLAPKIQNPKWIVSYIALDSW